MEAERLTVEYVIEAVDKIEQLQFEIKDFRESEEFNQSNAPKQPIIATIEEWNEYQNKASEFWVRYKEIDAEIKKREDEILTLKKPLLEKMPKGTWFQILTYFGVRWVGVSKHAYVPQVHIADERPEYAVG